MIRIAILGATGRMGQTLVRLIASSDDLTLVGAATEPSHVDVGSDPGLLAAAPATDVRITDQAAAAVEGADAAIDFTLPVATSAHLDACVTCSCPMVIGTTGLSDDHYRQMEQAAGKIGIVYGRNMSIGVNLLTSLARQAARVLDTDYDVEITEAHHRFKVDAPSGTALQLAEAVADARDTTVAESAVYGRHGQTGQRPPGSIGIHALRAGRIVGDHNVLFAADEEAIELRHRAQDRAVFARGALRAARWIYDQPPGLYGMAEVLGLN